MANSTSPLPDERIPVIVGIGEITDRPKESMDCFVAALLAMTQDYSATSAFICSTASMKSSLNSCTTAPADFTLSIRPTPWPTK